MNYYTPYRRDMNETNNKNLAKMRLTQNMSVFQIITMFIWRGFLLVILIGAAFAVSPWMGIPMVLTMLILSLRK